MKTLTGLIVLLAACLWLWNPKKEEQPLVEKVALQIASPSPNPFTIPAPKVAMWDLESMQGRVADITPDGILFECEKFNYVCPWQNVLPKVAFEMAQEAERKFESQYGKLLCAKDGVLQTATCTPKKTTEGRVLLINYPENAFKKGDRFKLVVAPSGQTFHEMPVFSARFVF